MGQSQLGLVCLCSERYAQYPHPAWSDSSFESLHIANNVLSSWRRTEQKPCPFENLGPIRVH